MSNLFIANNPDFYGGDSRSVLTVEELLELAREWETTIDRMEDIFDLEEIPDAVADEIDFMLGDIDECEFDGLREILERHHIERACYGWMSAETVPYVAYDMYTELFKTGLRVPFDA